MNPPASRSGSFENYNTQPSTQNNTQNNDTLNNALYTQNDENTNDGCGVAFGGDGDTRLVECSFVVYVLWILSLCVEFCDFQI